MSTWLGWSLAELQRVQGKLGKPEWFAMASSHLEFAACEEGGLFEALWTRAPGQEPS